MVFINTSNILGSMIMNSTTTITGSLFLTLISILIIAFILFFAFRVPFEIGSALSFPFVLIILAYNSSFIGIAGGLMIYLGIVIAFNFPYK